MKQKKIIDYFSKSLNPLNGLNASQIEALFQNAKNGNDVRLQAAFYEMERSMPIFGICIQKRQAALVSRNWEVVPTIESEKAKQQAEFISKLLKDSDKKNKDGFTSCLKHLMMYAFRGRSAVKPFFNDKGVIFKSLQNWNVLLHNGAMYWNPESEPVFSVDKLQQIPDEEVMCLSEERPIDIPGILIYLRQLIGEEQWSRFIEKCGLPQVILRVDNSVPDDKLPLFEQRAMQIFNGGSGVLPNGCEINELTSGRGQDPFSAYCEHQMRLICILACGSTGAVLGDVGAGLGSDVVSTQEQNFQELVSQDAKMIANTLNEVFVSRAIKHFLKSDEVLCEFRFTEKDRIKPSDYLAMALQIQQLGGRVDLSELKRLTNLSFISDENGDVWKPTA